MRPALPRPDAVHAGLVLHHASEDDLIEPTAPRNRFRLPIVLAVVVLLAVLAAMSMRQAQESEAALRVVASAPRPAPPPIAPPVAEQVKPAVAMPLQQVQREPEMLLSPAEQDQAMERLLNSVFSGTPAERLASVANGEEYEAGLDAFFRQQSKPVILEGVRSLPVGVKVLPGGQPCTLFELKTSLNSNQTAISRLIVQADGGVKLDWPMLRDSLSGALGTYAATSDSQPAWISVGVRRTFGFDESKEVRAQYHVFDVQGSGNGVDRMVVLLNRETPSGRLLDQAIAWNELFLVRLLIHWEPVGDKPRLCIIDADLNESRVAVH
jgi:hypothetical protein